MCCKRVQTWIVNWIWEFLTQEQQEYQELLPVYLRLIRHLVTAQEYNSIKSIPSVRDQLYCCQSIWQNHYSRPKMHSC